MAAQNKTYDTRGTNTKWSPSAMYPDEVLGFVGDNANLRRGIDESFAITLMEATSRNPRLRKYSKTSMISEPAGIRPLRRGRQSPNRRPARLLGPLTLGHLVQRDYNSYTCHKEVRLWSKFRFIGILGNTGPNPKQLQTPGDRPKYVTELSYKAREAGYNGMVVTKTPQNERKRIEYPEPLSHTDHNYLPQQLDSIIWATYKIIGTPVWTGEATRFFKHKKIRNWCTFCNRKHNAFWRFITGRDSCSTMWRTRHEYPVYQNESVTKP